jgi:hypothetical protein
VIEVKLTLAEMQIAAHSGIQRQLQNLKNNAQPAHGAGNKNDWQLHIEGALGEMALAKHLGVYWDGKGKMRAPDVGAIDVRTRSKHSYDLIVHDRDDDARYINLLTGGNGQYRVHGGIHARDAKQERYWKDPAGGRPAYFVPQAHLQNRPTQLTEIMEIQV